MNLVKEPILLHLIRFGKNSNLLNPQKEITAASILEQLGIDQRKEAPQQEPNIELIKELCDILKSSSQNMQTVLSDTMLESHLVQQLADDLHKKRTTKKKLQENEFVHKYIMSLIENTFNMEQKDCWERIVAAKHASGDKVGTLEELLDMANALALAIAASHPANFLEYSNTCSFVSTQCKQIQLVYEKLFKLEGINLPPVTCWTSLPLFLTTSQTTLGATFYFDYLAHAITISRLIERNIVSGAVSNMVAWMNGQEGKSVKCYLDSHTLTPPYHIFFRPVSDASAEVVVLPEAKTLKQTPYMFFNINGCSEYNPEQDDEPIIIGYERGQVIQDTPVHHFFQPFSDEMVTKAAGMNEGKVLCQNPDRFFQIIQFSQYQPEENNRPGISFADKRIHSLQDCLDYGKTYKP